MLIDGHSIAFRAYYALPADMQTSSGQLTNAVYGFVSMLTKAIAEYKPDKVVVVFDAPGETFRDRIFEEYKAQRPETPEPFRQQEPLIREVVDALGIPQLEVPGYEADDVIATVARQAAEKGHEVLVVTGDRDAMQLVRDPSVKVVYNRKGVSDVVTFDEKRVQERYGVNPSQYVQYAAMRGDPSDNIPGVSGVGEKRASELLRRYGSIDGIYEHLGELSPKLREAFEAARDDLDRNVELIKAVDDVPLPEGVDDLPAPNPDPAAIERVFSALEFKSLLPRVTEAFGMGSRGAATDVESGFEEVDEDALDDFLASDTRVALAVSELPETKGSGDRRVALALATAERCGIVGIDRGPSLTSKGSKRRSSESSPVEAFLGDPTRIKDAHDFQDLIRILGYPDLDGVGLDTAVAAYLLRPGVVSQPELAAVAAEYAGLELGEPQKKLGLGREPSELARRARATAALVRPLTEALEKEGMWELYDGLERPLIPLLASMEKHGVRIDADWLEQLRKSFASDAARLERDIHRIAGEQFNVRSTQQLGRILYEKLGLQPPKATKTGYATDAATLESLREEHPIVEKVLAFREQEKLRSMVESLAKLVGSDGRVHPRYNQTATATGRISTDNPNVQNVPVRTPLGRQMRRLFCAEDGWMLVAADYSQIELRVLAHLSGDEGLVRALVEGRDVHAETAARVFGTDPAEVTEAMRRAAKMVNYGLSYGLEAYGLAQRLGIETEEAHSIISRYFESFPGVKRYMEEVVERARRLGYTETLLGRRRYIPEVRDKKYQIRRMGERMAMNAPVQGTAADILKSAMVRLEAALRDRKMRSRQVLQVHDEIVVESPEEECDEAASLLAEAMKSAVRLDVPLEIELGIGENWDEAKSAARPA